MTDRALLDAVIRSRVEPFFQPIVDIGSGEIIGYEALARWPEYPGVSPGVVFEHARETGQLVTLDRLCREAAVVGAVNGGLSAPLSIFVNVEPSALRGVTAWPFPDSEFYLRARADVRVIVELTERNLLADPAGVLAAVTRIRELGCGVALDDVGSNPDSLALLPLIRPDVVKLDRDVVVTPLSPQARQAVTAVTRYAAASGAHILCEGIETPEQLETARTLGATLAQGFMLGKPAAPPPRVTFSATARGLSLVSDVGIGGPLTSPARALDAVETTITPWSTIMDLFTTLEDRKPRFYSPGCLVIAVQHPELYPIKWDAKFADYAASHSLVGVVGAGRVSTPGVRGAADGAGFVGEFAFAILDQNSAEAVVARDLGDTGPLESRRYEWAHTHDRDVVVEVLRCLVRRLAPADAPV